MESSTLKTIFPLSSITKRNRLSKAVKRLLLYYKIVTKNELQIIFLLYQNLKSRTIEDGIDKEAFFHFCQMPVSELKIILVRVSGAKGSGISFRKVRTEIS